MESGYIKRVAARLAPERKATIARSLDIISNVHDILVRRGMTYEELAQLIDISEDELSDTLSPLKNLEPKFLLKLEEALAETPDHPLV